MAQLITTLSILTAGDNKMADNLAVLRSTAEAHFPCIQSPNMAVGVNVLFKLVEKLAAVLGNAFDVEIVDYH